MAPLPARRSAPADPAPIGLSVRMLLVSLGIGVGAVVALSLASLLPR